ncbi:hypothetical protein KHA90_00975 [Flavobacterium psychroterrae]|uniref:PepSY domain-containing protein n=1 Tax=Flavobacterium psychroterrae TaxID=2133767 RepID=A0ABS5P5L9_9FLAO|nr:hypothetical protein [Flavobacterium psychroterrae]MBS7229582.1 hypothetical protein [Flavobacterium psychroterrae]
MKNLIMMFCLIIVHDCYCQSKKSNKQLKKNKMEYFNIDKYKDWEFDNSHLSTQERKFYKKRSDRVEINFFNTGIQVRITNVETPYKIIKGFSNESKRLSIIGYYFYQFSIKTDKEYDDNGKLIKEINYDLPYKFSLKQVIDKVKKEYQVDLENIGQESVLERFESNKPNKKTFYEVYLKSNVEKSTWNYVLIDGTTGEVLFKTSRRYPPDNEVITIQPFDEYIKSLKKDEEEKTAYHKTYKGKDYTKEEWEVFEEDFKSKQN